MKLQDHDEFPESDHRRGARDARPGRAPQLGQACPRTIRTSALNLIGGIERYPQDS
jgi:hypothetical protein